MKRLINKMVSLILDGMIGRIAKRRCPDPVTHVETDIPVASLTFDDGPHPLYTPELLRILGKYQIRATFFVVGEAAEKHPELVKAAAEAGHVIGNHSYEHYNLSAVNSHVFRLKQLRACRRATCPHGDRLFRPPFGMVNKQVNLDAWLMGYRVILWNVSAEDWIQQKPEEISYKLIERIVPGSIVLLHDAIFKSTRAEPAFDRGAMLNGLEMALAALQEKLAFVTVPELLRTGKAANDWSGQYR